MGKADDSANRAGLVSGTLIDGRYKVVRYIGQGGNGVVHEVEHVLTGRRLAVKSLHDEASYGRLEQEARATSLMKNGHAVKVTDMGMAPGAGPYIVMELLEGQSLRNLLDDTGQLPLELTINIALQVCECLAEAHQHGIVHRDLKPDNVYLCQGSAAGQYDVKVLDFGVVKIQPDGPIPNSSLTRTGSTVGTPFYMSLEQLRNSSAVDQRTDIYALGVVLYESLSGRKPFQAETIGDLVYALCSGPPTHLGRLRPDLPPAACDVIMRALSSTRDHRQSSMPELATDLAPFGDPAYGLWLRSSERGQSGRMSTPMPPSSSSHTPSGVKVGPDAPPPPPSNAHSAPPPADSNTRLMSTPPVPHATAESSTTGDRDTPTEMYVKGVHGGPAGGPPRPGRPQLDSQPGDRDTPTRAMEAIRRQSGPPPRDFQLGGQALHGNATPASEGHRSFTGTPFPPSAPIPGQVTGNHAAMSTGLDGIPSFRPAWQTSLDRALLGVGNVLERSVGGLPRRFRAASPRAQIAMVIVAATLFAVLVVLTLWLATT